MGLQWEEVVGDKVDCEADKEEEEKMDWGGAGGPVIEAMRIRMRMMTLVIRMWMGMMLNLPWDGVTEVGRAGTDLWKALILFYNLEATKSSQKLKRKIKNNQKFV